MNYPFPKIGYYQAECCLLDLYKIENQQDLDDVLERIEDNDEIGDLMIFKTLSEAISNLRLESERDTEKKEFERLGWVDTSGDNLNGT